MSYDIIFLVMIGNTEFVRSLDTSSIMRGHPATVDNKNQFQFITQDADTPL